MTKRIGIDLDGTVADYMSGVIPLLKEHYGIEPSLNTKAYRIEDVFDLDPEDLPGGKAWRKLLYEELHLFRTLPKREPDIEQLTVTLKDRGYKVYIVTARPGIRTIKEDTQVWLDNNGFQYDDIFYVQGKGQFCSLTGIRVMLEDEAKQILDLQSHKINIIVPDQQWNRHLSDTPRERKRGRIKRIYNWREALDVIEEFLK